jgi:hypothetical protein
MGRACNMNGEKRNAEGKVRDHWKDQDVDGRTMLKCILER